MVAKVNMDHTQVDDTELLGDDSYTSHLATHLNQLREDGTLCDVTIIIDNQRFQAHRAVLSASSTYFNSMFTSGFQESMQSEVKIKEGTAESFAQLLKFAYTGFFRLSLTNIIGIFSMACFFDFTLAINICTEYINRYSQKLTLEDAFAILNVGEHQADLNKLLCSYLLPNFMKFAETKCFLISVSKEFLLRCLTAEEIETDTTTEEEV